MKKVFVPMLLVSLVGCSPIPVKADAPKLDEVLISYNQEGYTKKTVFYLTDDEREMYADFHAGANTKERRTYYNSEETALLMGDYKGGFEHINSGYRNIEEGIQHFTFIGETITSTSIFSDIKDDWTNDQQKIGDYYPTLTSLSSLVKEEENKWTFENSTFTYTITGLELNEGKYNDAVLDAFQYFAAPMLLETLRYSWSTIRIKEEESYLSIRLLTAAIDHDKSNTPVGDEYLISEARVYKGIVL